MDEDDSGSDLSYVMYSIVKNRENNYPASVYTRMNQRPKYKFMDPNDTKIQEGNVSGGDPVIDVTPSTNSNDQAEHCDLI